MTIKLLSLQIPTFWQSIKYAAIKADGVKRDSIQKYLNELLLDLLNDTAQCFVRLDDEKQLQAIMITRLKDDKLYEKRYLLIQCMFSFIKVSDDIWTDDMMFLNQFAQKEQCSQIIFETTNKQIIDLAEKYNFKYSFTTMSYNVGGE